MTKEQAYSFYIKGLNSGNAEEKLFCFYDAFLCLYGVQEGVVKAAESCKISPDYMKKAIDFANADSECDCVRLTDSQLELMQLALQNLLC